MENILPPDEIWNYIQYLEDRIKALEELTAHLRL